RERHSSLGAKSLVGLLKGPLAGAPAGRAVLGRTRPRRLRPPPTPLPGSSPPSRPHPRPPQSRTRKPRHHSLGPRLEHLSALRSRHPRSTRHQQPATGAPLRSGSVAVSGSKKQRHSHTVSFHRP